MKFEDLKVGDWVRVKVSKNGTPCDCREADFFEDRSFWFASEGIYQIKSLDKRLNEKGYSSIVLNIGAPLFEWWVWPHAILGFRDNPIVTIKSSGMNCCECNELYAYAESNMSDGRLCCYSCRQTVRWKYNDLLKV